MGKRRGKSKGGGEATRLRIAYDEARRLAERGEQESARRLYRTVGDETRDTKLKALVTNDLAALAAAGGDVQSARQGFQLALAIDPDCQPARLKLV